MASQSGLAKRRLQIIVKESACPRLIANLANLPEGCENVFIRAVLMEWFADNNNDTELATRLVEQYRTIEFRNEVGIKPGEHGDVAPRNSITAIPADRRLGQTVLLERTASSSETVNRLSRDGMLPPESSAPPPQSLVSVAQPIAAPMPTFNVDFDPDQF